MKAILGFIVGFSIAAVTALWALAWLFLGLLILGEARPWASQLLGALFLGPPTLAWLVALVRFNARSVRWTERQIAPRFPRWGAATGAVAALIAFSLLVSSLRSALRIRGASPGAIDLSSLISGRAPKHS